MKSTDKIKLDTWKEILGKRMGHNLARGFENNNL
jgi:hypothetical protein